MVPAAGFEPATYDLQGRALPTELSRRYHNDIESSCSWTLFISRSAHFDLIRMALSALSIGEKSGGVTIVTQTADSHARSGANPSSLEQRVYVYRVPGTDTRASGDRCMPSQRRSPGPGPLRIRRDLPSASRRCRSRSIHPGLPISLKAMSFFAPLTSDASWSAGAPPSGLGYAISTPET